MKFTLPYWYTKSGIKELACGCVFENLPDSDKNKKKLWNGILFHRYCGFDTEYALALWRMENENHPYFECMDEETQLERHLAEGILVD